MFVTFEQLKPVFRNYRRSPYVRVLLIVVAVHLVMFVLTPPFHFKPYTVAAQDTIEVVLIPDNVIPPPPEEIPEPPVIITPGDTDDETRELPITLPIDFDKFPPPAPIKNAVKNDFVPFDKAPVVKKLVRPEYPDLARQAGIEGIVRVLVTIGIDGKVKAARVASSDVTDSMNQAALTAARKCTFKAAEQAGKKVGVTVMIPFEFRLTNCR